MRGRVTQVTPCGLWLHSQAWLGEQQSPVVGLLVLGEEHLAHGATSLASAPLSSSEPPDLHFRNTFALYFYHDCSKCYSIPLRVGYIVMFICISSNFGLRPSHCD